MSLSFDKHYLKCAMYSIAMVVANPVRGDSRVLKTAFSLSKRGFKVHLFGVEKISIATEVEGYPFRVTLVPNPIPKMKKQGVWRISDEKLNIDLFIDKVTQSLLSINSLDSFDFLHTHDMYGLPIGAKLREQGLAGEKGWIHDLHEYVEGCTHINESIRLYCLSQEVRYIKQPDALTSVSPILSHNISEKYDLPLPIDVLNTPRLSDFDPHYPSSIRRHISIDPSTPLLVYCGNVKPERGVHYAVEALPLLPDAHLLLLTNSGGPYLDKLKRMAESLNVAQRFHTHAYVPYYDVTSFLRGATCGIYPITQYGNADLALPTKLFEYLHAGIPVASTSNAAMSEFINQHQCGETYDIGDVNGLVKAVKTLSRRFPSGLPNATEGSELIQKYCWETQEKGLYSFYDKMLSVEGGGTEKSDRYDPQPIVHLPTHAANQPGTLARAITKLGGDAKCAALGSNRFKYDDDISIESKNHSLLSIDSYLIEQKLSDFNCYHFHARPLLYNKYFGFPTGFDFLLLKAMGKRVFFHFRGSEIRLPSVFKEATPFNYVSDQLGGMDKTMPYLFNENDQRAFRKYVYGTCDEVFANDPELQCYIPNTVIVPRAIELEKFDCCLSGSHSEKPLIVHAPSRPGVKGTQYVLEAIDELHKQGYDFDFTLVEKLSHSEAISIYRKATIIIDQLRIGWYGVLAVEGMAMGKAVVSYIRNDLRHYLPAPSPIAQANPENIVDVLKHLLENETSVDEYGKLGRKFVEDYHSADVVAKHLIDLYCRPVRPINPTATTEFIMYQTGSKKKHKKKKRKPLMTIKDPMLDMNYFEKFFHVVKRDGTLPALKLSSRAIWKKLLCNE